MEFVSASEEKRDRNEYFSGIGLNSGADFNRPFLKPPGGDSGQNSLECWDYTVELEMLKGPSDLHLAAELGKTLLERNRELEATIREMRTMIEDKTQEIEYLSKQTAALREVNNSRLRIYEQLEVSIQDLEKNNQRMNAESVIDKRKIKSLTETIEHLEAKCEELQRVHEESANSVIRRNEERLQSPERTQRKSNPPSPDVHNTSNEDTAAVSMASKALKDQVKALLEDLHKTRGREAAEAKRKELLEIELSCLTQENAGLKEQIEILKESDSKVYDDHLTSPDTTTSSMLCRKCMGFDDTGSNVTMQDIMDDLEDMDESYEGECALIRLQNGGYAWGSQESLASRGQVMGSMGSKDPSPRSETSGTPHNSLLYELDTQYRVLIEKYEALVEANKQAELQKHKSLETGSFVHMGVDENSGPMGFVITEPNEGSEGTSIKCQRCATCTCDMKASTTTAKPLHEELSEVETASSGFSEEERRYITKTTQTDFQEWNFLFGETADDLATPTPLTSTLRFLDLKSPQNPCNSRFQNVPEVQKLFSEIFENLKRTDQANVPESDTKLKEKKREKPRSKTRNSSTSCKNSNKENLKPSKPEENKTSLELKDKDVNSTEDKPNRPNFLDLETSSTCSSRSRRRRKSKNRKRMDHSAPAQDQTLKNTDKNITNLEKREESVAQTNLQPTKKTDTLSSHISSDVNLSASLPEIRVKCPHKMKKKKQKSKVNQLENKHLSNVLGRPVPSRSPTKPTTVSSYKNQTQPGPSSHVLPSVQVANLIRVEKSYAEVLKSKPTGYH